MSDTKPRRRVGIELARAFGRYSNGARNKPGYYRKVDPQRVFSLRAQGWTQRQIAEALGIHVTTVRRYLRSK